ncbi:MAG: DEAD/DEAH box helicase [Bacteroidales bacterium]|nr:DEAD/DEAH box helicase [Bacteroidales bacterium]
MKLREIIENKIDYLKESENDNHIINGEIIYNNGDCQILSQSAVAFEFYISSDFENVEVKLIIEDNQIYPVNNKQIIDWDKYAYASLLQLYDELKKLDPKKELKHKKYSREGMIKRVLAERKQKAVNADYRIDWADNIYGDHILTNERGIRYKIFLRDFENQTGYSDSMDAKINKLGTTKHIMYAFKKLKEYPDLYNRLSKHFPFIEIYLDPLNDYRITWYYPYELPIVHKLLISKYFGKNNHIDDKNAIDFIRFIDEAKNFKEFVIRPEVLEKIERLHENIVLEKVTQNIQLDYQLIKLKLFDYQKEGIKFAVSRKASIIADEMGLGKTVQAIATAVFKKELFDFKRSLIICPASIKDQWKKEIEKFTNEKAIVVQGTPEERLKIYQDSDAYFLIVNYETLLRDHQELNKTGVDFLILDEAQRVKNYATKTARSIKNIDKKHVMVITGTPIENKLLDLFSIMSVIDPWFLGPQWEFSYQYCLFDPEKHNKINGYYNLSQLKERLKPILIRREKRKVIEQLPNIRQIDIPVAITPEQMEYHASYSRGVASILRKKFITPFDMQRMMLLLANMRMVCNSTFLVDNETNFSPKLEELKFILLEKLDVQNSNKKIIIFSEWVKMHKLIAKMLRENNIGFVELNGSVPVKLRGELIRKFETNNDSKIFLSTEAGGVGLNLQVADTVINFELPWNPAKKNQRIGRIDRLGQKSSKLTVLNFITRHSIEEKIASGLILKQNLFEGVLDQGNNTDIVDFTEKGRAQFLDDIKTMVEDFEEKKFVEEQNQVLNELKDFTEKSEKPVSKAGLQEHKTDKNKNTSLPEQKETAHEAVVAAQEMEQVLNQGLGFITGIFKMATGKELAVKDQKIEVNKETGEVTMKFKLPGFN